LGLGSRDELGALPKPLYNIILEGRCSLSVAVKQERDGDVVAEAEGVIQPIDVRTEGGHQDVNCSVVREHKQPRGTDIRGGPRGRRVRESAPGRSRGNNTGEEMKKRRDKLRRRATQKHFKKPKKNQLNERADGEREKKPKKKQPAR